MSAAGDAGAASRSQHFGPDAGRAEAPDDLAVLRSAELLEQEDVLHGDDVALHAGDLGDARDAARAVAEARLLHDDESPMRSAAASPLGMLVAPIAIIVSIRVRASRGVFA
jgi:hypothetical protein